MDTLTFNKDPLAHFLYMLMLTEIPAGKVENMINMCISSGGVDARFTNGWLVSYATTLANSIRDAKSDSLLNDLIDNKELDQKELEEVERQLIQEVTVETKPAADTMLNKIDSLRASGGLSKEDADRIEAELKELGVVSG